MKLLDKKPTRVWNSAFWSICRKDGLKLAKPPYENKRMTRSPFRLQFSLRALLLLMLLTSAGVAWYSNLPISLNSSSLNTAHYNYWTGTLTIRFQSGDSYRYFDVPNDTWRGLKKAESHGKYFYKHIRAEGYEFEKIKE